MIKDNARILIIGAGVNGSICAARLHTHGANVTVLARGSRYQELRDLGIVIENPFNLTRTVTRVPVIDRLELQDAYDYILVIVRKNQVADLYPVLRENRSPNVVFMINNPSGPQEYIQALGPERVLMGFVFGAGKRDGSLIRGMSFAWKSGRMASWVMGSPFGEPDGTLTPRLKRLVSLLQQAGFPAATTRHISDELATHAAMVAPLAGFFMQRGFDPDALRRYSIADLSILVEAMRQVTQVLHAVGVRVDSGNAVTLRLLPKVVWAALFKAMLPTKFLEVGAIFHLTQAPDEMRQLIKETQALVERSGLAVPALRNCLRLADTAALK